MMAWRLTHRIHIQKPVEAQSEETGEMITVWETVKLGDIPLDSYPAEVLTGTGKEINSADTTLAKTTARINFRWFPVDRIELYKWRILWDGRIFNIQSAETDRTARQEWRLRCEDGLNDG